jgi:hypothetical protein
MDDLIEQVGNQCRNCAGCGWVCEDHADNPWSGLTDKGRACCGGAGMPCGVCNLEMASAGYVDAAVKRYAATLADETDELSARLIATRWAHDDNGLRQVAINPEGLEAAAAIRTLRAERDFHDQAAQEALVLANAAMAERDAAVQAEVAAIVGWLRGTPHANWQAIAEAVERGEYKEPTK